MMRRGGFTLIELMLSMSFVSILLISIAMLAIQLSNQYTRGLTLKEIAQAGTEVSNDIKRTMTQSQIAETGVRLRAVPSNGGWVLCTGTYSYVANSPANLEANSNLMKVGAAGNMTAARFARVKDRNATLCTSPYPLESGAREYEDANASELLGGGSRLLVVRDMGINPNTVSGKPDASNPFYQEFESGRGIYMISITIGTGVESEFNSNKCRVPKDTESNLEFCAIDTFEFTSRVGNSGT